MYEIVEEKMIRNITNSVGQRTALSLVHIVCDTASDMPSPLPHWISGSRCDVLENGGSVYLLSSQRTWTNVNFYNQGGEGGGFDPDDYYTKPQTDAKITEKVAEIVADAPEDFDTLKEMSDWIDSHEDSAAAMNSAIQANTTAIAKKPGEIVTGKQYTIDGKTVTAGVGAEVFNNLANNKAAGPYSHAEGHSTTASGPVSHAEGYGTIASGVQSHAEGINTTASGDNSHAEGHSTTASGVQSHAEGGGTASSGSHSHAEGSSTTASGASSHAEGGGTNASGSRSHAEGGGTEASGSCSHAEGVGTKASSDNQHVQGRYNVEDSNSKYAFIIGNGTEANGRHNAFAIDWNGLIYVNGASTGVDVSSMGQAIEGKVDKITGKGLSTEDYTTAEKTKLAGLSNYDDTALSSRVDDLEDTVGDINTILEGVL